MRARAFRRQDLANMLWAFAKADHVAAILFDNMQREFEAMQAASSSGSLDAFKAQVLSLEVN